MFFLPRALLLFFWLPVCVYANPLQVFVSVPPLKAFVEKMGGEHVIVHSLIGPGYNPATYHLTPRQVSAISQADLYVRTGLPFEKNVLAHIESSHPTLPILDVRTHLALRTMEAHSHGHDAAEHAVHDEKDPHVWTSPPMVKKIAHALYKQLSTLDPAHTDSYTENRAHFIHQLDLLDKAIRQYLDGLTQRQFLVFHPSWGYFADTYGLKQVAIEHEGKQPGANTLAHLIEQAKKDQIKAIFVQPQFDQRQAKQIAQAINGHVISIDPLAENYFANLRQVSQRFAQALQP